MIYRIHQIKLRLGEPKERLPEKILKKIGVKEPIIKNWHIVKESIDARNKGDIRLIYSIDFETDKKLRLEAAPENNYEISLPRSLSEAVKNAEKNGIRPVVAGFGPAGIFAALILAQAGLKPLIIERGRDVDKRSSDVEAFWNGGTLDFESNVQFGEGGAGAFSDGKLTTGIKDARIKKVVGELIRFGAPDEIAYRQKPHIGTDILRTVVRNIREEIKRLGGEIRFETKVSDVLLDGGRICGVVCEDRDGLRETVPCRHIILAIGHSARDTFYMLRDRKVAMEQKPFSIGVRIEHSQDMIDISQYGMPHSETGLPPAEYKLSYRCAENGGKACFERESESGGKARHEGCAENGVTNDLKSADCMGRGVYTFCMCPGGEVINASSERGGVVVNGMSLHARNSGRANSALLCDVRTSDFESEDVLAGVEFQRKYERRAYEAAGFRYTPPETTWGKLRDGEAPEVENCLPEFAAAAFREAMPQLGKKLHGFDSDSAKIYAVETRSSSPVRILRGKDGQSISAAGIFPCGEGAGYAGGITSAAVDGIKMAEAVMRNLCENI